MMVGWIRAGGSGAIMKCSDPEYSVNIEMVEFADGPDVRCNREVSGVTLMLLVRAIELPFLETGKTAGRARSACVRGKD